MRVPVNRVVAIAVGVWLGILLIAFVKWTAPGELAVRSFQGRYLIPVAPLTAIALQRSAARGLPGWARNDLSGVSNRSIGFIDKVMAGAFSVARRYLLAPRGSNVGRWQVS